MSDANGLAKTIAGLVSRIREGDERAVARVASLIENRSAGVDMLLHDLADLTGRALVIGITGAPGVGKSTLVDQMTRLLRSQGKTVGIIAVDPSSPYSGGAILGDRIRMQQHFSDTGVFIRSMATRGASGGLAKSTADLAKLLDASGRDVVIIETVGVGQNEVEIARLAEVTILVLAPGGGDDIQGMKAGVIEIADIFVINKADLPGADQLEQELAVREKKVLRAVAATGEGIAEIITAAGECRHAPQRFHDEAAASVGAARIDHLGIAVKSVDSALKFYEEQLGLTVEMREFVAQEKVNVAMLPVGESRVELLEPSEPDSVIAKFIDKRGEGLHHVALKVPDLNAVVERLKAAGARILNEPRAGAGGHIYTFVHPVSTGGVLLELIQE
jgi:LAO/AO transport system kinase